MSGAVALSTLRAEVRKRADVAGATSRHSNSEVNAYINNAWDELQEFVAGTSEEYFSTLYSFNTVAGTSLYALPSDFNWLRDALAFSNGWKTPLERIEISDLSDWYNASSFTQSGVGYVLIGTNIQIVPTPTSAYAIEMRYVSLPVPMVADSDTIPCAAGWEEFVVWRAASVIIAIDGRDNSVQVAEAERQKARILAAAHRRNLHQPRSILRRYKVVRRQRWF